MARAIRFARLACAIALVSVVAGPVHAVRLCHNVCTCSASCDLTCRDDAFVPTTCGASIYDCVDKCFEPITAQAGPLGVAPQARTPRADAAEQAQGAAACTSPAPLPLRLD
jgi:hypothetical protein